MAQMYTDVGPDLVRSRSPILIKISRPTQVYIGILLATFEVKNRHSLAWKSGASKVMIHDVHEKIMFDYQ